MNIEEWRALGRGWLAEEIARAWHEGWDAATGVLDTEETGRMASAYAERAAAGHVSPANPDPLPIYPSKDENAA